MPKSSTNKREEIALLLENAILTGRLKPGTRLPAELKLARELGVSQASIREALQDLEGQGLIVKYRNRSTHVIALDGDDLANIHQVRRELEPLACAMATAHLDAPQIAALQNSMARMRQAAECRDFIAYSHADLEFHRLIWRSQPNRYLEKSLQMVCLPLFAYDLVRRHSDAHIDYDRVTRQHALLLTVMQTKDTHRAEALMRRLLDRWMRQDRADFERLSPLQPSESSPAANGESKAAPEDLAGFPQGSHRALDTQLSSQEIGTREVAKIR